MTAIDPRACEHCGSVNCPKTFGVCPRIKAIEYYPDGISIKRIEYHEMKMITGIVTGTEYPQYIFPKTTSSYGPDN